MLNLYFLDDTIRNTISKGGTNMARNYCKELCEKLLSEEIKNSEEFHKFFAEATNKKNIPKENEALEKIYTVFLLKEQDGLRDYTCENFIEELTQPCDDANMKKYIDHLERLKTALMETSKATVKLFSIFGGVGTAKYYKKAAQEIGVRIKECEEGFEKISSHEVKELKKFLTPNKYDNLYTVLITLYNDEKFKNDVLHCKNPQEGSHLAQVQFFFRYLSKDSKLKSSDFTTFCEFTAGALFEYIKNFSSIEIAQEKLKKTCEDEIRTSRQNTPKADIQSTVQKSNPVSEREQILFDFLNSDGYGNLYFALKALCGEKAFKQNVLNSKPLENEICNGLRAVKFFFEWLTTNKVSSKEFEDYSGIMAAYLRNLIPKTDTKDKAKMTLKDACETQIIASETSEAGGTSASQPPIFRGKSNKVNNLQKKFQGITNFGSSCYLATALQELFYYEEFSKKVLNVNLEGISDQDLRTKYGQLMATQFFFKYLNGDIKDSEFTTNKCDEFAKSYFGHRGEFENSAQARLTIEKACRDQMRMLKNARLIAQRKASKGPRGGVPEIDVRVSEGADAIEQYNWINWQGWNNQLKRLPRVDNFINNSVIITQLYNNKSFKKQVDAVDENELNLREGYKYLETMKKCFDLLEKNKFYSPEGFDLVKNLGNDMTINGLKSTVLNELRTLKGSKKSRGLAADSTILAVKTDAQSTIVDVLKHTFGQLTKEGRAYRLPLKSGKFFSIQFPDRADKSRERNTTLHVDETIDLTGLVKEKQLEFFSKGLRLPERGKYVFNLTSASIGTGEHYYLFRKMGTQWKEFNDGNVWNKDWPDIKKTIDKQCETLTYELKP